MLKVFEGNFLSDFLILLLVALILFSPLIYGSVTILPLSILESASFLALFILLLRLLQRDSFSLIKIPFFSLALFILLIIFQLLPLPENIVSFLSPATASLYKDFRINPTHIFYLSIYLESTVNIFLQFLTYLAIFLVILNYIDTKRKERVLLCTIIISGFLYSFYGIIRKFSVSLPEFSTFTNSNHFAAYLEMIIPLSIAYSLTEVSKSRRFIIVFITVVQIIALFLTLSRGGIICFSLSIFGLPFLLRSKRPIKKEIVLIIILFLFLSLFLGIIGIHPITEELKTIFHSESIMDRLSILKDGLKIIQDFPFFGTGLGTFKEIFPKYKSSQPYLNFSFAHNEPIQLLVETGFLGFILFFLFLFYFLKEIFLVWFRRKDPFAVYITLGILAGVFSIILHSFFDFVLHVPANAFLFFVILALGYRIVYTKEPQNLLPLPEIKLPLPKSLRSIFIIVFVFLLIFMESLVLRRYQAESIFKRVKENKVSQRGIEAIFEYRRILKKIDQSIILNPLNSLYLTKRADLLSELAARGDLEGELVNFAEFKNQDEVLGLAEKFYKKAIDLTPTKADLHLRLGQLYSISSNLDLTRRELKKAILLDPTNSNIQYYINNILREQELK